MSEQTPVVESAGVEEAQVGVEKKTLGIGFWLSVGWLVLIIVVAAFAPFLQHDNPDDRERNPEERSWFALYEPDLRFRDDDGRSRRLEAPSLAHWLGTDADAKDIMSRSIDGARVSLVVGFTAVMFGFLIGGTIGLIGGFVKGWFDKVSSFVMIVLLSFPALILAILITSLVERSLFTVSLTLGVLSVAPVSRLARSASLVFSEREFVTAARTMGAKPSHIMLRELLPNVIIPMSALALLGTAVAIVAEGGLAFLGLSVPPPRDTWGGLILRGRDEIRDAPWVSFGPIGFLFLTVMSLNYAGDRLRDYFDVREISL